MLDLLEMSLALIFTLNLSIAREVAAKGTISQRIGVLMDGKYSTICGLDTPAKLQEGGTLSAYKIVLSSNSSFQ